MESIDARRPAARARPVPQHAPHRRTAVRGRGRRDRQHPPAQGPARTADPPRQRVLSAAAYPQRRSEEHTSELQSLMRISYAVFCLKKKKTKATKDTNT